MLIMFDSILECFKAILNDKSWLDVRCYRFFLEQILRAPVCDKIIEKISVDYFIKLRLWTHFRSALLMQFY